VTPPVISYFTADMNQMKLSIAFSEPVRALTLDCTRLELHLSANATLDTETVALADMCINSNTDSEVLEVSLCYRNPAWVIGHPSVAE
jgi:hypothetical protein